MKRFISYLDGLARISAPTALSLIAPASLAPSSRASKAYSVFSAW